MEVILQLRLLGTPEVKLDKVPVTGDMSGKAQAILYYLAVTGCPQSRSVLANLLWGDRPEAAARTNLRKALADLRQPVGAWLEIDRQTVGFKSEKVYWVDAIEFEARARAGSSTADIEQLQAGVALYQGDFLAGFQVRHAPEFETWALAEQARLRELMIQALHTLAEYHAEQGELTQGIAYTRRLLSLEPWREAAHRQLMLLLAQDGQRSAALTQYETCVQALAEELDVEPGAETIILYERIRDEDFSKGAEERESRVDSSVASLPPPSSSPLPPRPLAPPHNLPPQPTSFVGRDKELTEICQLLLNEPTCRLLTLVGPGGIGKTRLAIQAAQKLIGTQTNGNNFADGILFVPLASVSAPSGIVSAIAEAANFNFYSNVPPRRQLLDYLREKQMLLVLDNFEHLLEGSDLVSDILAAAPAVKVLVTSREGLNVQEAWFHPLAGLTFPEVEDPRSEGRKSDVCPPGYRANRGDATADLLVNQYDAIRLFEQSARRARLDFSLAAEQEYVVRICQLVGGMPLGIELAAAWLKILPAKKIAAEIEQSLDILTTRLQNVPERHRSMRAVFEHSWQRLSAGERDVLKRLSVFHGNFDQEAAEQISGASLMTLATLVEKSLLYATATGRYQMHELLRQFADEKLEVVVQEANATREKHSAYYLDFLKARQMGLLGKEQQPALDEIGQEIDNIQAAWNWAVEDPRSEGRKSDACPPGYRAEQNNLEAIYQAVDSLYNFYQIRSRYQEGEEIFANAATQLQQAATLTEHPEFELVLNMLSVRQGAFYYFLGDFEAANKYLQAGLQTTSPQSEMAFAFNMLGKVARLQDKKSIAEAQLGQGLAISREIGDLNRMAEALHGLAEVAGTFGEYATGQQLASESLAISRQLGRPDRVAQALSVLAWNVSCLGAYSESKAYYEESLAICQKIGDRDGIAIALNHLGWVAWCIADLTEATAYCEKALAINREIGHRWNVAMCLGDLALMTNESGEYERATQYSQEGVTITQEIGNLDLMSYHLYCLGAAACGLGDFQASRNYLAESLQTAWRVQIPSHVTVALFHFAMLLVKESDLADFPESVKLQQKAKALELLTLVIDQPATWQAIKDRASHLQAELESMLPAVVVTRARAQGESQTLEAVVAEILQEARPADKSKAAKDS